MNREDQARAAAAMKAAEEEAFGNPGDTTPAAEPTAPVVVEPVITPAPDASVTDPAQLTEPVVVTPAEPVTPAAPAAPVEDADYWKKRFTNFKAASDANTHGLRQENMAFRTELQRMQAAQAELNKRIGELTKSDSESVVRGMFTDAEREIVGEETIKALEKMNAATLDAKIEPIQAQLDRERTLRQEDEKNKLETDKANFHSEFMNKLATIVPEYKKFDTNPQFHAWMKEPDVASGMPRVNIFKAAQGTGDVGRVAEFFLQFQELTKPVDKLEGKVTPVGGGHVTTPGSEPKAPVITQGFIDKFYDDSIRGRYKGRQKEQQEIKEKIDAHLRSLGAAQQS